MEQRLTGEIEFKFKESVKIFPVKRGVKNFRYTEKNRKGSTMKKTIVISAVSLFACGVLYGIEQGMHVNYLIQSLVKIALFLLIPAVFYWSNRHERRMTVSRRSNNGGNNWIYAVLLGVLSFGAVLGAYLILSPFIDFAHVVADLQNRLKVTQMNYLLIGAYVIFINSLLEEVFFRGFVFAELYKKGRRFYAYFFSSLLFAAYHISIFRTWFEWPLMILALLGIMTGGLIFCWLNRHELKITYSWIAHVFADIAIIGIGYTLFF